MPQVSASWFQTCSTGVKAKTGLMGRRRDRRRAESPDWVKVQMYFASSWSAISTAARVMAPPRVLGLVPSGGTRSRPCSSVDSMIRAMVLTVSIGYLPTLVSPESMTASAPSSTALAQSEASARVGRGLSIMDSSTWVATMTGLAQRRASSMARFCTIGTSSSGSSTPRSPRATMMASKASMISWSCSTACGFSILAITGTRRPSSSMISWTRLMSEASRTKDRATMSTPRRMAQRRSSSSFSLSAGTLTATPGRLMPLLLETMPPTITWATTLTSSTSMARRATLPSSISRASPGLTSSVRLLSVVEQISLVPGTSSVVIVKCHRRPGRADRRRSGPGGSSGPAGRP